MRESHAVCRYAGRIDTAYRTTARSRVLIVTGLACGHIRLKRHPPVIVATETTGVPAPCLPCGVSPEPLRAGSYRRARSRGNLPDEAKFSPASTGGGRERAAVCVGSCATVPGSDVALSGRRPRDYRRYSSNDEATRRVLGTSQPIRRGTVMTAPVTPPAYVVDFSDITLDDVGRVGGKNASLGELFRALKPQGVGVARRLRHDGGRLLATARDGGPRGPAASDVRGARYRGSRGAGGARTRGAAAVLETPLPDELRDAVLAAYDRLCAAAGTRAGAGGPLLGDRRGSAEASFAGAARRSSTCAAAKPCCARFTPAARPSSRTVRSATARGSATTSCKVALSVGVHADGALGPGQLGRHLHARYRDRGSATPSSSPAPTGSASSSSRAS